MYIYIYIYRPFHQNFAMSPHWPTTPHGPPTRSARQPPFFSFNFNYVKKIFILSEFGISWKLFENFEKISKFYLENWKHFWPNLKNFGDCLKDLKKFNRNYENSMRKFLEISELYLEICSDSGKFSKKFQKFRKIY